MNTQINAKLVKVTPEIAMQLLSINVSNRPMNQKTVDYYSKQMKDGLWTLSGQTISVSDKNTLLDGQHRCAAVIKSGCTINFLISYGVPYESFLNYDMLRTRGLSDVFAIENINNYVGISSILTKYNALKLNQLGTMGFNTYNDGGGIDKRIKFSTHQMLNLYNDNKILLQEIYTLSAQCYKKIKFYSKSQLGAIMFYLIKDKLHNEEIVYSFFRQLIFNENVQNSSIYNLREKLIAGNIGNYKMVGRLKYIYLVKCWNAYVKGKEIKSYVFGQSELMPTFI